jgi:hypothetical protein
LAEQWIYALRTNAARIKKGSSRYDQDVRKDVTQNEEDHRRKLTSKPGKMEIHIQA